MLQCVDKQERKYYRVLDKTRNLRTRLSLSELISVGITVETS